MRGELPARAGLGKRVADRRADAQQRRAITAGHLDQPAGAQPMTASLPPEALRRRQEDRVPDIRVAIRHGHATSGNSPGICGSLYPV